MEKMFLTTITLFLLFAVKAQTPVKPLYMKGGDNIPGAYYKDINNNFNNFVGTWQFTNGTTTFKIVLEKKQQIFIEDYDAYYDILVGEYQYVLNGVEKVNTLNDLTSPPLDVYDHNIVGVSIIKSTTTPICYDCTVNERRVLLNFSDPSRPDLSWGLSGDIVIKRADVGTTQK